jgi:hypothetical protein
VIHSQIKNLNNYIFVTIIFENINPFQLFLILKNIHFLNINSYEVHNLVIFHHYYPYPRNYISTNTSSLPPTTITASWLPLLSLPPLPWLPLIVVFTVQSISSSVWFQYSSNNNKFNQSLTIKCLFQNLLSRMIYQPLVLLCIRQSSISFTTTIK